MTTHRSSSSRPGSFNWCALERTPTHEAMLQDWWRGHGGVGLPMNLWPRISYLVHRDGVPYASCFALRDVPWTMLSFYVTNPFVNQVTVGRAMRYMVQIFLDDAVINGCTFILISCNNQSFRRMLHNLGFLPADSGVTLMMKGR